MKDLFTEGGRSVEMSCDFEPGPGWEALAGRLLEKGQADWVFTHERSWRERLWSWPWYPWFNGVEYSGLGLVTVPEMTDISSEEPCLSVSLRGSGPLERKLVRL